jgi:hypothetical protein
LLFWWSSISAARNHFSYFSEWLYFWIVSSLLAKSCFRGITFFQRFGEDIIKAYFYFQLWQPSCSISRSDSNKFCKRRFNNQCCTVKSNSAGWLRRIGLCKQYCDVGAHIWSYCNNCVKNLLVYDWFTTFVRKKDKKDSYNSLL